jgi:hypothetical protein
MVQAEEQTHEAPGLQAADWLLRATMIAAALAPGATKAETKRKASEASLQKEWSSSARL